MKKEILNVLAAVVGKTAKFGAGSVSYGLTYQPKTPDSLKEKVNKD